MRFLKSEQRINKNSYLSLYTLPVKFDNHSIGCDLGNVSSCHIHSVVNADYDVLVLPKIEQIELLFFRRFSTVSSDKNMFKFVQFLYDFCNSHVAHTDFSFFPGKVG